MTIGDRIKEMRIAKGWSQQELSNEMGMSVDTVRSLEINRAKPSVDSLQKLAEIFECSTDYLLGRNDNPQWNIYPDAESFLQHIKEIADKNNNPQIYEDMKNFIERAKNTKDPTK